MKKSIEGGRKLQLYELWSLLKRWAARLIIYTEQPALVHQLWPLRTSHWHHQNDDFLAASLTNNTLHAEQLLVIASKSNRTYHNLYHVKLSPAVTSTFNVTDVSILKFTLYTTSWYDCRSGPFGWFGYILKDLKNFVVDTKKIYLQDACDTAGAG